jgi:hypothetical protein
MEVGVQQQASRAMICQIEELAAASVAEKHLLLHVFSLPVAIPISLVSCSKLFLLPFSVMVLTIPFNKL